MTGSARDDKGSKSVPVVAKPTVKPDVPAQPKPSPFAKVHKQDSKVSGIKEVKPESKPTSKTTTTKKKNTIAAAFAIQSKNPKKPKAEKVIISETVEEPEMEEEVMSKESKEEKARKKEQLENIFQDDEDVMGKYYILVSELNLT